MNCSSPSEVGLHEVLDPGLEFGSGVSDGVEAAAS
jgi:hypothetical protein